MDFGNVNGIPFNEEQIENFFQNLPQDRQIPELAKFMFFIHKSTKTTIKDTVNIEECTKRHSEIEKIKRSEIEKDVNRFSRFLGSLFFIGEKIIVVVGIIYFCYKSIVG